jgi:holin-like protein
MSRRKASILIHMMLHRSRLLQVGLIVAFWFLGELLARLTGVPVPGSVIGMAGLLGLLASGAIQPSSMKRGASFLLADMLLFFVPAVLAVLDHSEFLGLVGVKILAVILIGTVTVMSATALAVDLGYRMMLSLEKNRAIR